MEFDLRPGDEVAGHRLERTIGRGGMSVVYLAEHLRLGRRVAFKVLAPQFAEDPGFRQRFIRESRTAAALDHPNIVTVYDAGEFDGLLYISMRYVEGSDLSRVLSEDGAIEPWRTLTIVSQMGSALDAAHAEGLVHRDVKPGNILLSQPGTPLERAFLSDFGVTKRMTTSEALTRTGQFVGTVDYVAPEQILGGSVDGRTDVYSLGCVLFQCLSGQIPFPRPTDVATIYAHLHDETPAFPEGAFPGMDPVISRALAKDKEDRYPSCTALVEASRSNLHEGAETEIKVAPTGISEETTEIPAPRRPPRRRLVGWILAAAITITVVMGIAIALAGREPGTVGATSPSSSTIPTDTPTGTSFDPARLHWNKEDRSTFAQATREVAFTDAISRGRHVIAVGHADDPDEDAVVWTKVAGLWQLDYVAEHHLPGYQRLDGIASVGTNRLVTVGYDSGHAVGWYSDDDGASWAAVTGLDGGTDAKAVVEAPDGTIWTLGRGAVWSSPDGASWTSAPSSAFPSDAYAWNAIVYGNDVIAVGQGTGPSGSADAAVWVLRDGAWTRIDAPTFDVPGSQYLRDVSVDPVTNRLVAVGTDRDLDDMVVWTSEDGATWRRTASFSARYQGLSSIFFMPGTPGSFVAGGWNGGSEAQKDAAIWYSRDGIHWALERGRTETYDLGGPGAQEIRALVRFGSGGIVAYAFGVQGVRERGQPLLWNATIQAS